jgi:hypothetical protein
MWLFQEMHTTADARTVCELSCMAALNRPMRALEHLRRNRPRYVPQHIATFSPAVKLVSSPDGSNLYVHTLPGAKNIQFG